MRDTVDPHLGHVVAIHTAEQNLDTVEELPIHRRVKHLEQDHAEAARAGPNALSGSATMVSTHRRIVIARRPTPMILGVLTVL